MKFLVTGGAGFIGSNICELLVKKNHEVSVIDNLNAGQNNRLEKLKNEIDFFKVDIRNRKELEEIIKDFDGIFHHASLVSVSESIKEPQKYFDVNVKGTKNIFEIAKKKGIRIVYATSASVYGNVENIPIKEDEPKKPINPYGQTKLENEILAEQYKDKLQSIGLRYFNVYGRGQTDSYAGVITKFLQNIKNKKSCIIEGDGNQTRDFIHVKDIAEINLRAMESKIDHEIFNIGTGIATSINQLVKIMMDISKHKISIKKVPKITKGIEKSQADMTKTRKLLGWKHKIDLRKGLEELIED